MTDLLWQLGALAGAIVAGLAWFARKINKAEQRGRQEAEDDAIQDMQERIERGRAAVQRGRDDSPVDRMRRNDGAWR